MKMKFDEDGYKVDVYPSNRNIRDVYELVKLLDMLMTKDVSTIKVEETLSMTRLLFDGKEVVRFNKATNEFEVF